MELEACFCEKETFKRIPLQRSSLCGLGFVVLVRCGNLKVQSIWLCLGAEALYACAGIAGLEYFAKAGLVRLWGAT